MEARETLTTALGKQEVFRMRVYTEFSGKLASKRDMTACFTADGRHVPVRIEAELVLGSIVAELTDYKQGKTSRRHRRRRHATDSARHTVAAERGDTWGWVGRRNGCSRRMLAAAPEPRVVSALVKVRPDVTLEGEEGGPVEPGAR